MLTGRSVLIVETEALIAIDIQSVLESLGTANFVVAYNAFDAMEMGEHWASAALAVVEVEPFHPELMALARTISQAGIPVIAITADSGLANGLPDLQQVEVLLKPVPEAILVGAVQRALARWDH